MKTILSLSVVCVAFFITTNVFATEKVTMKGTYKSLKYGSGPMTGIFTKTGAKKYSAVFNFVWKKKKYTYTGTIKGNPEKGNVNGVIFNESKKRRFIFKGKSSGGKMTATQSETYGKFKTKPRGTFEIKK